MSTVTEAIKRIVEGDTENGVDGDLDRVLADPARARHLAGKLADRMGELVPGHDWTLDDLRELVEIAARGGAREAPRVLEGRDFRKQLREQCRLADCYKDPFACVVLTLTAERGSALYSSVLDAVSESMRRSDMVFLYSWRIALLLPRMGSGSIQTFLDRIDGLIEAGPGAETVEHLAWLVYPHPELAHGQAVLDWAEDQLRDA